MTRTTIKDIAAAVGVSHTTVSYVLNNNPKQKISEKTRTAILETARKLNYVPNETARSLRKNSPKCIAVALEKSITHRRFYSILQGIREELIAEGYGLLLMDFHIQEDKNIPDYMESVLQRRTDGIIYIASDGLSPEFSQQIADYNLPFVGCDCCPEEEQLASVSFDYERGAFEVACRLLGEGVSRLIYWQPDVDTLQEQYRIDGLRQALALYPHATLDICKMPYVPKDSYLISDTNAMENLCRQSLFQSVVPKISNPDESVAVICSWSIMVKHLGLFLYNNKLFNHKIAILSDSEVPLIPNIRILSSRPCFVRGGRTSAKLLLSQLNDHQLDNRIVIAPEPPVYV